MSDKPDYLLDDEGGVYQRRPAGDGWFRGVAIAHSILFVVLFVLMIKVVPMFERIFKGFDAELPGMTRLVIDLQNWVANYWFLALPLWPGELTLLWLAETEAGRSLSRPLSFLFPIAFLAFVLFAAFALILPLVALIQKLS